MCQLRRRTEKTPSPQANLLETYNTHTHTHTQEKVLEERQAAQATAQKVVDIFDRCRGFCLAHFALRGEFNKNCGPLMFCSLLQGKCYQCGGGHLKSDCTIPTPPPFRGLCRFCGLPGRVEGVEFHQDKTFGDKSCPFNGLVDVMVLAAVLGKIPECSNMDPKGYPFQGLEDIISSAEHLFPEEKTLLEDGWCQGRLRRIRDAKKKEMKDFVNVNGDLDEAEVLRAYVKKHGKLSSPILVLFRVMQSAGEERMENAPALRLFNELLEQPLEGFKESYEGDVQLCVRR